jgi:hypothetical protein
MNFKLGQSGIIIAVQEWLHPFQPGAIWLWLFSGAAWAARSIPVSPNHPGIRGRVFRASPSWRNPQTDR